MVRAVFILVCSHFDVVPYQHTTRRLAKHCHCDSPIVVAGGDRTIKKCFAKAEFKQTETTKPGTTTNDLDDSEKITDAWRKLWENNAVAKECAVDEFATVDSKQHAHESFGDNSTILVTGSLDTDSNGEGAETLEV